MLETGAVQALFIHDRLIADALSIPDRAALEHAVAQRRKIAYRSDETAHVGAYEQVVAQQLAQASELSLAVVEDNLTEGALVTLTQDFYFRRESDERGAFRTGLDVDRGIKVEGRFSISRLVGSTGKTEIFGRKRLTMLAYVGAVELKGATRRIELRPTFIGWRVEAPVDGLPPLVDTRTEVWPQEIDQFKAIGGKRVRKADMEALSKMSEKAVKEAFADIIGEPFVPKDWPGETSDLFTNRLSIDDTPVSAAFAFKGPGKPGKLHIADMGKRGDQGIRLAHEPADLLVVQHHDAVVAAVRHLMAAIARQNGKRFMILDGATTAVILSQYKKLPQD